MESHSSMHLDVVWFSQKLSAKSLFLLRIRPPRIHNILYIDEILGIYAFVISIMYYFTVDKHEYIDTTADHQHICQYNCIIVYV